MDIKRGKKNIDDPDMSVYYPAGIFKVSDDIPGTLAPIEILKNDIVYVCPICGIVRVDRKKEIVFFREHDHRMFIDPAEWKLNFASNAQEENKP